MDRRCTRGLQAGLATVAPVPGLAGCNTMEGMGEAIEEEAGESE